MEWFVVKYWLKYKILNKSDMEIYVNEIINERANNWYKINFINPKIYWYVEFPQNVVPLINTVLCIHNFSRVHISLEKYPYSIDVIVAPILNYKL